MSSTAAPRAPQESPLDRDLAMAAGVTRRLYVLPGFDPRGPAPLHALLRQVFPLPERPRLSGCLSRWPLDGGDEARGASAAEEIVYLHWSDIARSHWPRQPLQLLVEGLPMARWYLLGGGLRRVGALAPGAAFTGLYPVLVVALLAATALAVGLLLHPLGLPPALLGGALVLLGGGRLAGQLGVGWLFRTLRFTHQLAAGRVPELGQRVGSWAQQLLALERDCPAAELVLAGHSCGSFVAVMLVAELRRLPAAGPVLQRLTLLTLGHNIPHLALLPAAGPFRADLAQLLEQPRLPWLDWTSPDDWLCFAGVNPLAAAGLVDAACSYPQRRLLPLAGQLGIAAGWRGFWGRFSHQYPLHFAYLHWLPLRRRQP